MVTVCRLGFIMVMVITAKCIRSAILLSLCLSYGGMLVSAQAPGVAPVPAPGSASDALLASDLPSVHKCQWHYVRSCHPATNSQSSLCTMPCLENLQARVCVCANMGASYQPTALEDAVGSYKGL